MPGIIRKGDEAGSLEVIGRGKPLFYINGRQVRDLNELKQLSSEEIKSVEVIQNPGVRYDASVSAVVRIRTTRLKGEGWGISLTENLHQGKKTSNLTTLKLNYRRQSLDVYAGGSFTAQGSLLEHQPRPDYSHARYLMVFAYGAAFRVENAASIVQYRLQLRLG